MGAAGALGENRYSPDEMRRIARLAPGEKAANIRTLSEAIRLFQASGFTGTIDNVRVLEEATTVMWAFHKPGFHAVRTNTGCCASDSNWLIYMLSGRYDEIGCLSLHNADGNGHIINYIKGDGAYYFVDMMMQRFDSLEFTGAETGDRADYDRHDFAGYIHRADGFAAFLDYCANRVPKRPVLFTRRAHECLAVGTRHRWEKRGELWGLAPDPAMAYLFLRGETEVLFAAKSDFVGFTDTTAVPPDWNAIPSFDFHTLEEEIS